MPTSTREEGARDASSPKPCAIITKVFSFEAAHFLPEHTGKCARLHGHTYQLELSIRGPLQTEADSSQGMVMDFATLTTLCRLTFLDELAPFIRANLPVNSPYEQGGLDHNTLNWIIPGRPTAERVAHWIWDVLVQAGLPDDSLHCIRLWETPTSCATITHAERVQPTNSEGAAR